MFFDATGENLRVPGQQELSGYFSLFSHFTRLKTLKAAVQAGEDGLNQNRHYAINYNQIDRFKNRVMNIVKFSTKTDSRNKKNPYFR